VEDIGGVKNENKDRGSLMIKNGGCKSKFALILTLCKEKALGGTFDLYGQSKPPQPTRWQMLGNTSQVHYSFDAL
jgi:hypothetical protein